MDDTKGGVKRDRGTDGGMEASTTNGALPRTPRPVKRQRSSEHATSSPSSTSNGVVSSSHPPASPPASSAPHTLSQPTPPTPPQAQSPQQPLRVKIYAQISPPASPEADAQWKDIGLGHCETRYDAENGAGWIVVRREVRKPNGNKGKERAVGKQMDEEEILLRTRIEIGDDDSDREEEEERIGRYEKSQDTMIVWTESDGSGMALSFARADACAAIWTFISGVIEQGRRERAAEDGGGGGRSSPDQGKRGHVRYRAEASPSPPSSSPLSSNSYPGRLLPDPALSNTGDCVHVVKVLAASLAGRERVVQEIIHSDFIKKLIPVQQEAEDLESIDDLHLLCCLMQSILLLNDPSIFEYVLQDDVILGVMGILEYDPEFPTMKASFRAHLADSTRFREVVPIRDPKIRRLIHYTYRLQYLKDVVLARILEDPTYNILNAHIYFNQTEIVRYIQDNDAFLRELFGIFAEQSGTESASLGKKDAPGIEEPEVGARDKKYDAILFIQQLCSIAKVSLSQNQNRAAFFASLVSRGLLWVIEYALSRLEEGPIRGATIDILITLIEYHPNSVRNYCLKQRQRTEKETGSSPAPSASDKHLVPHLIRLFHEEEDLGLKAQMAEALRVLVDAGPDGMSETQIRIRQEDPEAEKFLQYFYDECIGILLQPITDLPPLHSAEPWPAFTRQACAVFGHICDLLCFFVSHHSFRSKYYLLSSSVSASVCSLFRAEQKHLRLAALRYLRACLALNDDFYNRHLIKSELFGPIVSLATSELDHENLLGSACLEFFEHVRQSNSKVVINHLMDRYGDRVKALAEKVSTFRALLAKWEQINEPPPKPEDQRIGGPDTRQTAPLGGWGQNRVMDAEEESWFNDTSSDDESEGGPASTSAPTNGRKRGASEAGKRKRFKVEPSAVSEGSTPKRGIVRSPGGVFNTVDKGKGKEVVGIIGLVDYSDEEEEATHEPTKGDDAASTSATADSDAASRTELPTKSAASAALPSTVPLPDVGPPPELKALSDRRRREEDSEDALGLLVKGASTTPKPTPPPSPRPSRGIGLGIGLGLNLNSSSSKSTKTEPPAQQRPPTPTTSGSPTLGPKVKISFSKALGSKIAAPPEKVSSSAPTATDPDGKG